MTGFEGDQGTPAVDLASVKGKDQNRLFEDDIVVDISCRVFLFLFSLLFYLFITFLSQYKFCSLVNSRSL